MRDLSSELGGFDLRLFLGCGLLWAVHFVIGLYIFHWAVHFSLGCTFTFFIGLYIFHWAVHFYTSLVGVPFAMYCALS